MSTSDSKRIDKVLYREEKKDAKVVTSIEKEVKKLQKQLVKMISNIEKADKTTTKLSKKEQQAAEKLSAATRAHDKAALSLQSANDHALQKYQQRDGVAHALEQKRASLESAIKTKVAHENEHTTKRTEMMGQPINQSPASPPPDSV